MSDRISAEVVVLGSGFAGSLCSLLLNRLGIETVVIDKSRHPRFAIGESSTPIGNIILRDLCARYDLPRLAPLSEFGSWQDAYPEVVCGRKRGFSYFQHLTGQSCKPNPNHANELLVAANIDDKRCDTHWFRADVDHFLVEEARRAGVIVFEDTNVISIKHDTSWYLTALQSGKPVDIETSFLIDASGSAGLLANHLRLPNLISALRTHSRALFSHFIDVPRWENTWLTEDHPFSCDDAALHHCLETAWMWMLRFANDRVSAGFVLDTHFYPERGLSAQEEWDWLVAAYPSLQSLFCKSNIVNPPGQIVRTGRLQRLWGQAAGPDWALLPHATGFIDPLHSTGIAHSLSGIERLVDILKIHWKKRSLSKALTDYSDAIIREFRLIDLLVAGCYPAFGHFDLLVPYTMLYFAAATTYEQHRLGKTDRADAGRSFLCADDQEFVDIVRRACRRIKELAGSSYSFQEAQQFSREIERAIEPYNSVGLFAPRIPNMYEYTGM